MKKLLILPSIFFLVIFSVFGQENRLYFEIQQAKKSNIYFEDAVLNKVSADTEALKRFINEDEVFFFGNISLDARNNNIKALSLTIPINNKNIVLELVEVPESFYNYEVMTSDGEKFSANREIKHYRGVVKNEQNSLAAITMYKNEIIGLISTEDGNFNIVKDVLSGKHLFYNEQNLKEKTRSTCGTVDDPSISYESEVLFRQRGVLREEKTVQSRILNKELRFYVETEYDIYQHRGSVSSVEAFILGLFNQVAVLYQNEDISTSISCLNIWMSNDPYTGTYTSSLLSQFQTTRTSFIGDLGILLTFREEVGGGQAAGFNGLCNSSSGQKLAVAMLETIYDAVPSYSWSIYVVTHELGHLLGSRHTHACVWNGNNTAIDGCAGYTESTDPNGGFGNCTVPAIPSNGGTIMSYCHWWNNLNFNLGFGLQPGNVIRNSVINASCLQPCNSPVDFTDQIVTTNITVTSCGDINVQNVKVQNGAKLILDAAGEVNIISDFEVEFGSEFEIK